ncbi:MAG: DUF4250 domain-containing protein [Gammaproteobacteria bacterium]|nr:DUF4250 domain-containing protein [Gammaproteobacteria bacterium]
MDLSGFATMDVHLLYSLINTRLRNEYADLQDLAKSQGIDGEALQQRLVKAGYHYDGTLNQFRAGG